MMTNADKYGMDEDEVNELTDKFEKWHQDNPDVRGYGEALFRFLQAEVKPTLTEDEKVILRNIDKEYGYIERVNDGTLRVNDKSTSEQIIWRSTYPHNHLFQFIQPRRRI